MVHPDRRQKRRVPHSEHQNRFATFPARHESDVRLQLSPPRALVAEPIPLPCKVLLLPSAPQQSHLGKTISDARRCSPFANGIAARTDPVCDEEVRVRHLAMVSTLVRGEHQQRASARNRDVGATSRALPTPPEERNCYGTPCTTSGWRGGCGEFPRPTEDAAVYGRIEPKVPLPVTKCPSHDLSLPLRHHRNRTLPRAQKC